MMMFVLLGAVSGEAVVIYTSQFYTLFFLTQTLKVTIVVDAAIKSIMYPRGGYMIDLYCAEFVR